MTNEWTVACKEFNIGVGRIDTILAQRTLSLEIRGFEDSDYRRLAEIYDAIFPERARSVEEWRFYDDSLDKTRYYFKRYTCVNSSTGVALGFGEMWNPPWMFHPKKFWFDGWVDPKHEGQALVVRCTIGSRMTLMSVVRLPLGWEFERI